MNYYAQLIDSRTIPLCKKKWSGNQRWYAAEEEALLSYTFRTYPVNEGEAEAAEDGGVEAMKSGRRTLFQMETLETPDLQKISYVPDGLSVETETNIYRQTFPWGAYGVINDWNFKSEASLILHITPSITFPKISKTDPIDILINAEQVRMKAGAYYIVFNASGFTEIKKSENGFYFICSGDILSARLTISFHIDEAKAEAEADELMRKTEDRKCESVNFWDKYLNSCPVHLFQEDYLYFHSYIGKEIHIPKDEINIRQLWHWWAVLINIADVEFNQSTPYIAPDRDGWYGTWSNDGPESLCALALTNQHPLARRCILEYMRISFDANGDLGWYTHSYGRSCLNHEGDSGFYSHGVPAIVHTVEFYIRHTGDKSLLDEQLGKGRTVWETLKLYIRRVLHVRDTNQDGLLEMNNLWEGWDDKIIPFFSKASLPEWIEVITRNQSEEVESFYREKCYPVTTLYEQMFYLRALQSMRNLAGLQEDKEIEHFSEAHYNHAVETIENRHWNPATGFYHDWDVRNAVLADSKNLDAFYYLYFVKDSARVEEMVKHFVDPSTFGLLYPPSLSADHPQFNPNGYWTGGYWPREMFYVGLSLNRQGYKEHALREVVKALCSQDGCVIAENMNPLTGELGTRMYTLAYSACLNIALLEITENKYLW